jgi:hypothetical protein
MSPGRNWDSPNPSPSSECDPSPWTKGWMGGGGITRLRVGGLGCPNSDDWRKSIALCLLYGGTYVSSLQRQSSKVYFAMRHFFFFLLAPLVLLLKSFSNLVKFPENSVLRIRKCEKQTSRLIKQRLPRNKRYGVHRLPAINKICIAPRIWIHSQKAINSSARSFKGLQL